MEQYRHIETAGLPPGFDIADLVESGITGQKLIDWCKARVRPGPPTLTQEEMKGAKVTSASPPKERALPARKPTSEKSHSRNTNRARNEPTPELPLHDCKVLNLADVESKPVEWLWPGRFPLGKLCLIGGTPSMGKTQIALWIAANITTGGKWPDSEQRAVIGDVLILSTEDDVADTIKPRLEAAGADVSRVHILQAVLEAIDDESR